MLRPEPGFDPIVSRRRVLVGGAALAVLAVAVSACSSSPAPPAVDELEAQLTLARGDSELATAAAVGTPQPVNAALTEVAAERAKHAQALMTEIADFEKMNGIRKRVDDTVADPTVAEALKPWYRQFCKRPCFHDEYLQAFNLDLCAHGTQNRPGPEPRNAVLNFAVAIKE